MARNILFFLVVFNISFYPSIAPLFGQADCNKLGAWLWYIEISGFGTHEKLADSLRLSGVKRIYVKVADGRPNPAVWPELLDKSVVQAYASRGLEVWGWSYNYPGNEAEQATALRLAAETGYQGFVVDVESEFDNKPTALNTLFSAFHKERDRVRALGPATSDFKLYCTTWGNPTDHKFSIKDIDPFVDGHMPQTYVENWGGIYYTNMAYWIRYGTEEYRQLGATKPIHHIVSTEKGVITPDKINEFFTISGPESSIWVVPGTNTSFALWQSTWKKVNWRMNFCTSSTEDGDTNEAKLTIMPNPASTLVWVSSVTPIGIKRIFNVQQQLVMETSDEVFDVSHLAAGMYLVVATTMGGNWVAGRLVVNE
jgi:hypothetical protein